MQIYFDQADNGEDHAEEYGDTMEKALGIILDGEGIEKDGAEVSVTFVSQEEVQSLNKEYRDVDRVTDVLSFPQFDSVDELIETEEEVGKK